MFQRLRSCELLNTEERQVFAAFLALLMIRVPNFRRNFEDSAAQALTLLSKQTAANEDRLRASMEQYELETGERLDIPVEELQRIVLEEEVKIVVNPQLSLQSTAMAPEIEKVLAAMKWMFLKAPQEVKFVCSDNPVSYNDQTHNPRSYWGVGLSNENIEVTFPISRDLACIGGWKQNIKERFIQATPESTKEINRRTVRSAEFEVYASQKSQAIWRLVQKHQNSADRVRVS